MIDLLALASTGIAFFLVTVAPGPATISNATVAMSHGRKTGLKYGLGLSIGLGFWGLIAASGMGAVLQGSVYLLTVLKVLGGLYLLWLAFLSGRSAWRSDAEIPVKSNNQGWFFRGLLLNMSNPKAVVAWMAALSVGLDSNDGFLAISVATAVCIGVGFATYTLYSVLFSIGGMMRGYRCSHYEIIGAGPFPIFVPTILDVILTLKKRFDDLKSGLLSQEEIRHLQDSISQYLGCRQQNSLRPQLSPIG